MKQTLTFGSLFAGIGGFDLGFERAGMVCKWQVEIDDYANRVLAKHWPNVHRERDIRTAGRHNLESVDVICGGFPCQDISYAGAGAGLDGARSGLFFEAVRVVRELRPRIVVLENVAALLTRGLDRVLGTLAEIGYDAEWHCIPAAAVGAPHIRDRVFVLAYSNDAGSGASRIRTDGLRKTTQDTEQQKPQPEPCGYCPNFFDRFRCNAPDECDCPRCQGLCECGQDVANANEPRPQGRNCEKLSERPGECLAGTRRSLQEFKDTIGREQWLIEPDVGRVANGVPARVDRLRGLGNAVVSQVAQYIGEQIVRWCGGEK